MHCKSHVSIGHAFHHTWLRHVLPQLQMLKLSIGKGRHVHKLMSACRSSWTRINIALYSYSASACAQGMCSYA